MKILGIFFQLICLLALLLAGAVYATGNLQCSFNEYMGGFTPEKLKLLVTGHLWVGIAAGALVLLAFLRGMGVVWNLLFSLACLAFIAEISLMLLGTACALPNPLRGMGWDSTLSGLTATYPVAAMLIPAVCVLGSFCSTAPLRISLTALICYALCYGCAELFHYIMLQWVAMPEPPMDSLLAALVTMPWLLAAIPAAFFLQYCLLMALFEAFDGGTKKDSAGAETEAAQPEAKPATPAPAKPTPTRPIPALGKPAPIAKPAPVVKPVAPVAPAAAPKPAAAQPAIPSVPAPAPKPEEPKPEAKPAATPEEAPKAGEAKPEAPKAEDKPAEPEAAPKAEEAKPEEPAPATEAKPEEPAKPEAAKEDA